MPYQDRTNGYRPSFRTSPFGRRFSSLLPWKFVVAVVLAIVLPLRHGMIWSVPHATDPRTGDSAVILQRSGNADVHHPVDVIRTIDGDTFLARVHFAEGGDL